VCSGTWGGQVVSNKISTSNCQYAPTSSFNIPFDQYRSLGANSGIFVKLPAGWTFTSVTSPDNEGDLVSPTSLTDERGETGKPIGWSTGHIPYTGYSTLSLVVQQPPSYGYIKQGNVLTRVTYYPDQAATTACGSVTTITTCSASPSMTGAAVAQCSISGTAYPIHTNGLCPSPTPVAATAVPSATPTPPAGCQYVAEACTNSIPPNCTYKLSCVSPKPTCAKNCALQPKGDASCNLVVDSEDYTIWRNNLDKNVGVGTSPKEGPDFNNDGKVNLTDLQKWQDGLFAPPPTPSGACAVPTSEVKPTSAVPTLGAGCFYKQVQCIQAPCPPVVVCPTATTCPAPQCAAPPAGCTYNKTDNCSCGTLVCPTSAPVASWTQMSTTNAPAARFNHVAFWTGSKMLVYGGNVSSANIFAPNPGYLYDPVANTWTSMTTTGTPGGTMGAFNGTKFIAYGGSYDLLTATLKPTGGIYDVASNTWTAMNLTNAPAGKRNASMISTGTKVIVWGGYTSNSGGATNTGAVFDIASNTWTPMSTTNAPSARAEHTAVWSGSKMIIFGGVSGDIVGGGALYDPATNTWSAMSTTNAPSARYAHTAVWSNNSMFVWGGIVKGTIGTTDTNTGAAYDPVSNSWFTLPTTGAPSARDYHSAIADRTNMIIWGGSKNINSQFLNDGGIYNILDGTWKPLPANADVPARNWHSAVWTGSKMIIWGGATATSSLNTGAVYSP
jgi:N-acetylneuraminic acid mutarotase